MRIAVVGDVLLDVDLVGSAERLAPDGPVPVVALDQTWRRAGGAGLVATLLAGDGVDVTLVTALADDDHARQVSAALEEAAARPGAGRIDVVATALRGPTPVKTRLRVGQHPVARFDEGDARGRVQRFGQRALDALADGDAIVVADYGRGVAEDPALRRMLEAQGSPIVWDPHPRGPGPVHNAALVTPNTAEAAAFGHAVGSSIAAAGPAAEALRGEWNVEAVAITLAGDGAVLSRKGSHAHVIGTRSVPAGDTCGAGDRLASATARALASGADVVEALELGVRAASAFVAGGGVATLADAGRYAATAVGDAEAVIRATRAAGGTVVATGGCFDLFHAGHARTLAAARRLGDCLVVCLNTDRSVRELKGGGRPIMNEDDRRDLLLALESVDAVVLFDEPTPETALRRLRPDVWVKAGDYAHTELPESRVLAEWGGRTVTVPYHPGRSTTRLARALRLVG